MAEVAGKVRKGAGQESGVDARDAEEEVQLGREAREEQDGKGVKAEGIGRAVGGIGQKGKGGDQRGLVPQDRQGGLPETVSAAGEG